MSEEHHAHAHEAGDLPALLAYMAHHNEHHIEELKELGEELKQEGKTAAYEELQTAASLLQEGSKHLLLALERMKEE